VLQRRNDAIAKVTRLALAPLPANVCNALRLQLEAARALRPRKRNYEGRGGVAYAGQHATDSSKVEAALADARNARACRHFFLSPGGSGCSRGSTCRFSHVLAPDA